eukprot:2243910-Rhodomonas_salina.1
MNLEAGSAIPDWSRLTLSWSRLTHVSPDPGPIILNMGEHHFFSAVTLDRAGCTVSVSLVPSGAIVHVLWEPDLALVFQVRGHHFTLSINSFRGGA